MKTIITMFLLSSILIVADTSADEIYKPVKCGKFEHLARALGKDPYNEIPIWIGNDLQDESKYVLFANTKRGTWTLIQVGTEMGCILGTGKDSTINDPSDKI